MKSKKLLISSIILLFSLVSSYADSFTDILQDLAVQTACIGQYSATQAGGGWDEDPHDYYTPSMMAERFKNMSGNMTRTTTFYGVCFDYAQFAYDDIETYTTLYNQAGMYENAWWMAGVHENPNIITLSYPTNSNSANNVQNGVFVKEVNTKNVKTHKMTNGSRATHHSWLWVMRNDGVCFWIDPTWTDNLGYVVYGYVANGEEIQLRPDEKYCINYPDYLKNLPAPPKWGKELAPSTSTTAATSTTTTTTTSSSSGSSLGGFSLGYMVGVNLKNETESSFFNFSKSGYEVSFEPFWLNLDLDPSFVIFTFDYLIYRSDEPLVSSILMGGVWGYNIFEFFQPYFGGALGIKWTDDFSWERTGFAWKVNAGIRIRLLYFLNIRVDISYGTILGLAGTLSVGMYL